MASARHQSDTVVKHWASPLGSGNWFFCKSQRLGCERRREGGWERVERSWEEWDERRCGTLRKKEENLMFSSGFITVDLPFALFFLHLKSRWTCTRGFLQLVPITVSQKQDSAWNVNSNIQYPRSKSTKSPLSQKTLLRRGRKSTKHRCN